MPRVPRRGRKGPLGLSIASGRNGAFPSRSGSTAILARPLAPPRGHRHLECAYLFSVLPRLPGGRRRRRVPLRARQGPHPLAALFPDQPGDRRARTQYLGFGSWAQAPRFRWTSGAAASGSGLIRAHAARRRLPRRAGQPLQTRHRAMGWGTTFAWATRSRPPSRWDLLIPQLRRRKGRSPPVRRHAFPFLAGEILTFAGTAASSAAIATRRPSPPKGHRVAAAVLRDGAYGPGRPALARSSGTGAAHGSPVGRKVTIFAIAAIGAAFAVGSGT